MIKLTVAVTPEALSKTIIDSWEYSTAIDRIKQHKILFTDSIKREYEKFFKESDNLFFYEKWFQKWSSVESFVYQDVIEEDFAHEVVSQMKKIPYHIVIVDECSEVARDGIKKLKLDDINNKSKQNEFSIYCLPVNRIIREGTSINELKEWLTNILQGEERINIIDGYILDNDENYKLLKEFYLPMMSSAEKIFIYYYGDKTNQDTIISPMKKQYKDRVVLKGSDPRDFHDRYIYNQNFGIQIGVGLDFVDLRTKKTRLETVISISKEIKPHPPAPYKR